MVINLAGGLTDDGVPESPGDLQSSIRIVRATPVVVPVSPPVETSAATVRHAPFVLIDVETADGDVGTAYVFCYTPRALRPVTALVTALAEVVVGMPLAPRAVARRLRSELRLLGSEGLAGMVLGGIDMALWDALAQHAELPLVCLLGGQPSAIPSYCSLRGSSPTAVAAEAEKAVLQGFRAVKVRVGHPNEALDVEAVKAALRALDTTPPQATPTVDAQPAQLMVDYNQALAPLSIREAARRINRLAELAGDRLAWVEEPLAAHDDARHAALGALVRPPIQLGENWWGPDAARRAIAVGAADIMMIDAMKIGGVSGWLACAAVGEVHGRPISSHLFPEISMHLLGASPTAHWLEVLDLLAPIRSSPISLRDGMVTPTAVPGIGLTWDRDAVRRFRVD